MIKRLMMTLLAAVALVSTAHAQAITQIPPFKLVASRDSFFIMSDDRAIGTSIYTVAPTDSGYVIKESTTIPNIGLQLTEVTTNKAGQPVKVVQSGRMGGQDIGITIQYANGRAKGTARGPGGKVIQVDAATPPSVVDDNMIQAVLPLLPWTTKSKWTLPVFFGGMNTMSSQTVAVTDELDVTIAGERIPAYRVELAGTSGIVSFYVAKTTPHAVLKIAPGGAPFEFVRAVR